MAYICAYTRTGEEYYNSGNRENYPGLEGKNCDVFDAMHLALSRDGKTFVPMRNNTGILFPKADFTGRRPGGVTKTLKEPWLFSREDGSFGVCAVRGNEGEPDPDSIGCMMLFVSRDLVRYEEAGFLKLDGKQIHCPRCLWREEKSAYYVEWETDEGTFCGYTRYFREIGEKSRCGKALLKPEGKDTGLVQNFLDSMKKWPQQPVVGNILKITEEEADRVERYLGKIVNTGVRVPDCVTAVGEKPEFESLPGAVCLYSDGSTHEKAVCWDREAYEKLDFSTPGEYELRGKVCRKSYPFPFLDAHMSDPYVYRYQGKYFLSSSGQRSVTFRISDTLEGLAQAEPVDVYTLPEDDTVHANMWAQELHVIHGIPYVFTTVGEKSWTTVRSHVLRCNGDPADPCAWEAPRLVVRPDGSELQRRGISLDMTYFCVDGVHYVMWSDRVFADHEGAREQADSADICIAVIDPDAPWQLVTDPVRILRPMYGWDRYNTEVDEGPFLLRRGDDLFVTISGASTGLADLYCLGLLHAKRGNNLLSVEGWDWLPYPVLTMESVPGEYGPGHNNFVKDPETGDDLMIYHAVPHDARGRALGRRMGIRRVHWAASGYPYLEMTPEQDLAPEWEEVTLKLHVR